MRCLCLALLSACAASALSACVLSGDDIPPPRIAAIVPPHATAGTTVTVEGDHFCPMPDTGSDDPQPCDAAGGILRFGTESAVTTRWTSMAIDAVVPAQPPGGVDVQITVGGRTSNVARFDISP